MAEKNQLIELIYDENLVLQGEGIFDSGGVIDFMLIEPGFFVLKVRDGKIYEVEIKAPFTKKQSVSCECTFYKEHKICKHVIAALFSVRNDINSSLQKNKEAVSARQIKKNTTLNINHLLDKITEAELKNFIRNYARRDKKIGIQLKVSFARKIDLEDNADKYRIILNSIISPVAGVGSNVSSSDVKAICQVLGDFFDQINDCIAVGQYNEAYSIFQSAFSKIEYVRHYFSYHDELLKTLSKNYHQIILSFSKEKLPPELRSQIIEFLKDLANRSYYHFNDINFNILNYLINDVKNVDKHSLTTLIRNLINTKPMKEKEILLALYIKAVGKCTNEDINYLSEHSMHLIEIADHLRNNDEELLSLKLLEKLYKPAKNNKDIINRLVFLYVQYKNTAKLSEVGKNAYYISGDIRYLDILKNELNKSDFENLLQIMESDLIMDNSDPNLLLRIYHKEEKWEKLVRYIAKLNNIDILKQYDAILYINEKPLLTDLYLFIIGGYLDEYLGDNSYFFLEAIKSHLEKQGLDAIIESIRKFIIDNYLHRSRLAEVFS